MTQRLESEGTPPFHLEATFSTFDYLGAPTGSGTLVEEWLKPGVRRRVITFGGLTWTQVSSAGVVRNSGISFRSTFVENKLITALLSPGPSKKRLESVQPSYRPYKVGTIEMGCVILAPVDVVEKSSGADRFPSAYCLSENPVLIRVIEERYAYVLTYNHFLKLADREFAKDVAISQNGKPRGSIHISTFRLAPELKDADFILPSGPDSSAEDVTVPGGVIAGTLETKVDPIYPADAVQNHIYGVVTLEAIIDQTGALQRLEVIGTPSTSLALAALTAVKMWKFKPWMVNGKPVEVNSTITVNFSPRH